MNLRTGFTSPVARIGVAAALFIASIALALAAVVALVTLGILPNPESETAQKTLREFVIRLILFSFLGSSYIAILWNNPMREWFLEQRWRLIMLVLFALGSIITMADPYHPIKQEFNWIRYATALPLAAAAVLAIANAMRGVHTIPDRLFGGAFGLLLLAAAADELFQFHEQASELFAAISPMQSKAQANDFPTLVIAISGVVVLCALVLIRYYGGWLGRLLRQQKYRLPMGLFAFSVLSFMAAMMLDSFDIYLQDAVDYLFAAIAGGPVAANDRLWLALTDMQALANSIEELLEYLSALGLLMMIGSMYSIGALGCTPAARYHYASQQ